MAKKPAFCLMRAMEQQANGQLLPSGPLIDTKAIPKLNGKDLCFRFFTKECGCRCKNCDKLHCDLDSTATDNAQMS
jgi:hypothetical protein